MKTKASGSDLQSLLCISLSRKKAGGVAAARSPRVPDGMRVARAAREADVGSMSGLPVSGRRSALLQCRTSTRKRHSDNSVADDGTIKPSGRRPSFDDLVGATEQRRRHGEAKRLGGLQIDDELKARR
jgi:hypothetical protein